MDVKWKLQVGSWLLDITQGWMSKERERVVIKVAPKGVVMGITI